VKKIYFNNEASNIEDLEDQDMISQSNQENNETKILKVDLASQMSSLSSHSHNFAFRQQIQSSQSEQFLNLNLDHSSHNSGFPR